MLKNVISLIVLGFAITLSSCQKCEISNNSSTKVACIDSRGDITLTDAAKASGSSEQDVKDELDAIGAGSFEGTGDLKDACDKINKSDDFSASSSSGKCD